MPLFVGGFAALIALAAGILAHVEPIASVERASLALIVGWVGANLWNVVTTASRGIPAEFERVIETQGEPKGE